MSRAYFPYYMPRHFKSLVHFFTIPVYYFKLEIQINKKKILAICHHLIAFATLLKINLSEISITCHQII